MFNQNKLERAGKQQHLTHHPKVEGLSLAAATGAGKE
jgi:hypothetical protein